MAVAVARLLALLLGARARPASLLLPVLLPAARDADFDQHVAGAASTRFGVLDGHSHVSKQLGGLQTQAGQSDLSAIQKLMRICKRILRRFGFGLHKGRRPSGS